MAGLGTKLWTSGEVVTAAGVNGYLQDQTIGKFASTSARDAAFGGAGEPTLSEGMFAYTSDTNTLWFYTGSAWEVATIKPSLVDAKGDLIAATAADTVDRLAVGTNGQVLTANSSASTGLSWALPKVLQVVSTSPFTNASNSTNVAADTGMSATITPSSASSKILILVTHNNVWKSAGNADNAVQITLLRGSSAIYFITTAAGYTGSLVQNMVGVSGVHLDSPATTSATTYKTQFNNTSNSAQVVIGHSIGTGVPQSSLTLMEISG